MQFINPEVLYLLFLLIIPILIHLFQLQRFQKVAFTNVRFLKEIEQQTRKSSKLKKLLILISRLLLFTCLIIAFAQPYFNNKSKKQRRQTYIYLDNSFSMQAKGDNGELFQKAKNDLMESFPDKENDLTLITNNNVLKGLDLIDLKSELLKMDYYPIKKDLKTVLLQIKSLQNKKFKTSNDVILISDFQKINSNFNELILDSLTNYSFVQTKANNQVNVSIDSIWISEENNDNIKIKSRIKSYQIAMKNISISFYLGDELFGKTTVSLNENSSEEIEFTIPNANATYGKVSLNDNKILFDNNLYFAFPKVYKTNVLVIGKSNKQFSKIYTKDEFQYTSTTLNQLDYSIINQQQLIILNALEYFPNALIETLKYFAENHGNLVIIPSSESDISTYNNLFTSLQIGEIRASEKTQKSITSINYNHPFFKNVFKKQIINFQYPTVSQIYDTYFPFGSSILQFEDQKDFISEIKYQNNKIYWIASPLNDQISNFFSSPLVVPVFYNFSLIDYDEKKLYFTIGYKNKIIIKSNSNENEVIHLTNNDLDFIPLQVKSTNHITITTNEDPLIDGLYQLKNDSNIFQKIAYNYDREESNLNYYPVDELVSKSQNAQYFTSVNNAVKKLNEQNKNKNLWQLFIIFALMFLGIEIILQKFLKI